MPLYIFYWFEGFHIFPFSKVKERPDEAMASEMEVSSSLMIVVELAFFFLWSKLSLLIRSCCSSLSDLDSMRSGMEL